jgi:predicted metal-dependent phosphoesterase TrpH
MLIDLQLHSTYSDGYLTPTQVAEFIASQGVKIAALTDHNTIRGQHEFRRACQKLGIKAIPGLELYVRHNHTRFNVLWFNFKDEPELHNLLRETQIRRKNQLRRILKKLKQLGLQIEIEKTLDKFTHYTPINRIVDELRRWPANRRRFRADIGKKNPREEEIIKHYFYNPKIGLLRESYVNVKRVVKLREKIGGQLILNHPAKYSWIKKGLWHKLKELGFDGIELLSPHHSIAAVMYMQQLARELDFIETGGSDFHRFEGGDAPIQHAWQYIRIDSKYLRGIEKVIGK